MKPKNVLDDGKSEASALLFAHNGREAQNMIFNQYEEKHGKLKKKHKDFIDLVIGDLAAGITTETSVTLEFIDRSERESFIASVCRYAKAEEIEERLSVAYSANSCGKARRFQTLETPSQRLINDF